MLTMLLKMMMTYHWSSPVPMTMILTMMKMKMYPSFFLGCSKLLCWLVLLVAPNCCFLVVLVGFYWLVVLVGCIGCVVVNSVSYCYCYHQPFLLDCLEWLEHLVTITMTMWTFWRKWSRTNDQGQGWSMVEDYQGQGWYMLKLHWGFSSQSAKSLPRTAFL